MDDAWNNLDLKTLPGHMVRRVHQTVVALFHQELGDLGVTPVQYAALQTIHDRPSIDQKTLANTIGYDKATIAGVIDRLEARGLVDRAVAPNDRRARNLTITEEGLRTLEVLVPRMLNSQTRLLQPLSETERLEFMRLLQILAEANAELSRIPTK